jgi:hypothetical protein
VGAVEVGAGNRRRHPEVGAVEVGAVKRRIPPTSQQLAQ